jgi:hypothetical protein
LFARLSLPEFERGSIFEMALEIWSTLKKYHVGSSNVKTTFFETYHREYENFLLLSGESIDLMSSRFQSIVNRKRANKPRVPYDNHDRALKLLHALDQLVWEVKVATISKSSNYETLTFDELFSKAQVH